MKTKHTGMRAALAFLLLFFVQTTEAATITTNFTGTTSGAQLFLRDKDSYTYSVSGTFVGTVVLERTQSGGLTWELVLATSSASSGTVQVDTKDGGAATYRFRASAYTSGTIATSLADATAEVPQGKQFYNSLGQSVGSITETGLSASTLSVSGAQTFTGAAAFSAGVDITGNLTVTGLFRNGTTTHVYSATDLAVFRQTQTADTAARAVSHVGENTFNGAVAQPITAGLFESYRTITTSQTDTNTVRGLFVRNSFFITAGQTLTNSAGTVNGIDLAAVTSVTGTLALSDLRKISIAADTIATGTRKTGIFVGLQSGATNNATIADNVAYTGDWFINQSGTAASTLGGALTVTGQLVGKGTAAVDDAATGYIGEYLEVKTTTATDVTGATTVFGDMQTLSLTAGDWLICGQANISLSTATGHTFIRLYVSTTTGGGGTPLRGDDELVIAPASATYDSSGMVCIRRSISSTTPYYFKVATPYATGNVQQQSKMWARRLR